MEIKNRILDRLELQRTMNEQISFKEQRKQAEKEEEEQFRQQVRHVCHRICTHFNGFTD